MGKSISIILFCASVPFLLTSCRHGDKKELPAAKKPAVSAKTATGPAVGAATKNIDLKPVYKKYNSPDGIFSVELPAVFSGMEVAAQDVPYGIEKVKAQIYSAEKEDYGFTITHSFNKNQKTDPQSLKDSLEVGANILFNTGKRIKREDFSIQGYPALSLRFKINQGGKDIYMHVIETIIGKNHFQIATFASDEKKLDAPDVMHFLQSFMYIGKK